MEGVVVAGVATGHPSQRSLPEAGAGAVCTVPVLLHNSSCREGSPSEGRRCFTNRRGVMQS